ncbi:hypothetical protein EXIGLDRAFT_781233 [Exidia glandulosa HHB12029]|uniref:Uncharacterized protein n=1 Tax=Exidia glandulosa HHB12029 TaxID=1314781 RepID=A0A165BB24_EXIGL|nr:hypothetical protein EXIGLDRAFT_781233 [Exidia glandulosa HHB12029]
MNALIAGHVLPSKSKKELPDVGGTTTTNKTTATTTNTSKQLTEKERIKAILPKFVLVPRKSYSPLRRSPLAPACAPSRTVRPSCDLPIEVLPSNSTRWLRDITNTNTNTNTNTPIANSKSKVMITKIFVDDQRLAVKMRMRRQRKFDDEDMRQHVLRGRMARAVAQAAAPPAPQAEQPQGRLITRTRSLTFPIPEKYSRRKDFGKPWAQRKAEIRGENLPPAPFFQ